MKACTKLLNPNSAACGQFLSANLVPTLDITRVENYYSWLKARKIFMNVGLKFTARIFLYLGVYFAFILIIFILLILSYLQVITVKFSNIFIFEALYFGMVVVLILFIFLHLGARVNKTFEEHISFLMEIKLNLFTL